jgi:superfamily II DNA or RNA helicase
MIDISDYFTGELQPHQQRAVEWLDATPKALLADDVGLGKTIEVIGHLCSLMARNELILASNYVLWVTSANLIEQTAAGLHRFAPILTVLTQTDIRFRSPKTPRAKKAFRFAFGELPDVVVISYQHAKNSRDALFERFGRPSMVVIDEVMALKGGGELHRATQAITKDVPRVIVVTATPFENDAMETYRVLQLLHLSDLWPIHEFKRRFVLWSAGFKIPGTWYVVDAKPVGLLPEHLPELRQYLNQYMLRRTAEDAGASLPARVGEQFRWVTLTPEQQRTYDEAAKIRGGVGHSKRTQIARQADGCSALVDALMEALVEIIDDKVIVYTESLVVLELVCERLTEAGIGHVSIEGKVDPSVRMKLIRSFEHDSNIRVLVGSRVLELGLNLQFCRVLISLDSSDNPQRENQREGRICRIGSLHDTYQHLLLMPYTPTAVLKVKNLQRKSRDAADLLSA